MKAVTLALVVLVWTAGCASTRYEEYGPPIEEPLELPPPVEKRIEMPVDDSPEGRLRRPSALHWPTGARRPFAAAGSGTGGAPACSFFSLSLQLACMQACTRIYCTSKIIKRGDKEAGKCLIGAWASMRYAVCAALVACRVQWSAMHAQCTQARGKAAGGSVISCQS